MNNQNKNCQPAGCNIVTPAGCNIISAAGCNIRTTDNKSQQRPSIKLPLTDLTKSVRV